MQITSFKTRMRNCRRSNDTVKSTVSNIRGDKPTGVKRVLLFLSFFVVLYAKRLSPEWQIEWRNYSWRRRGGREGGSLGRRGDIRCFFYVLLSVSVCRFSDSREEEKFASDTWETQAERDIFYSRLGIKWQENQATAETLLRVSQNRFIQQQQRDRRSSLQFQACPIFIRADPHFFLRNSISVTQ